jgi:hypothetical protein
MLVNSGNLFIFGKKIVIFSTKKIEKIRFCSVNLTYFTIFFWKNSPNFCNNKVLMQKM